MIFKNLKPHTDGTLPDRCFRGTVEIFKTRLFGEDAKIAEEEVFQTYDGRWFFLKTGEDIIPWKMNEAMNLLLANAGIDLFGKIPKGPVVDRVEVNYYNSADESFSLH